MNREKNRRFLELWDYKGSMWLIFYSEDLITEAFKRWNTNWCITIDISKCSSAAYTWLHTCNVQLSSVIIANMLIRYADLFKILTVFKCFLFIACSIYECEWGRQFQNSQYPENQILENNEKILTASFGFHCERF